MIRAIRYCWDNKYFEGIHWRVFREIWSDNQECAVITQMTRAYGPWRRELELIWRFVWKRSINLLCHWLKKICSKYFSTFPSSLRLLINLHAFYVMFNDTKNTESTSSISRRSRTRSTESFALIVHGTLQITNNFRVRSGFIWIFSNSRDRWSISSPWWC